MDVTVNSVTPELFRRFPDPAALQDAAPAELQRILRPVTNFQQKTQYLKSLSRQLMERHGGEVPGTMEELVAMPGVGRKTGGTVLSVCFGQPAIIVDTHFSRVSLRLGLTRSERPEVIEKDLAAITPREEWTAVSNVLNRFGRAVCHAHRPECAACPVHDFCE